MKIEPSARDPLNDDDVAKVLARVYAEILSWIDASQGDATLDKEQSKNDAATDQRADGSGDKHA